MGEWGLEKLAKREGVRISIKMGVGKKEEFSGTGDSWYFNCPEYKAEIYIL